LGQSTTLCSPLRRSPELVDRAQANSQGSEDWQVANLREMRRHGITLSPRLRRSSAPDQAAARAEANWLEARRQGKFELFAAAFEESSTSCATRRRCWARR